jgi:hypothetical protein
MPTIVVAGADQHKVYFKSIGYTAAVDDEIRAAIDSALLYNPTAIEEKAGPGSFRAYPTVFSDMLIVEADKEFAGTAVGIFDCTGRQVRAVTMNHAGRMIISVAGLPKGIYTARLTGGQGSLQSIKLIRN